MELLQFQKLKVYGVGGGIILFVDVFGGEFWINILYEILKYGFVLKLWMDYLYLIVGGILFNVGISGQVFRYGLQISNVY